MSMFFTILPHSVHSLYSPVKLSVTTNFPQMGSQNEIIRAQYCQVMD